MDGVFELVAGQFDPGVSAETRSLENPAISLNDPRAWEEAGLLGRGGDAGEPVNLTSFLSVPAVWACVGMIAGDWSKLPLEVFRRKGPDREEDYQHDAYPLINSNGRANEYQSGLSLWRRMAIHSLIWPRGFVWIDRDGAGRPVGLYNLMPDRTTVERIRGRQWVLSEIDGRMEAFPPDDVLIIEHMAIDECLSFGPLQAARQNVSLDLARRKFTSKFFGNGCNAGGFLEIPPGASDKAAKKVEETIDKKRSGDNAFRALVLRDGFKWHQSMVPPDQAQASELEDAGVRAVARFYRIQPSRLGVKDSTSYNSQEWDNQAYQDQTLSYWLTATKAEANLKLLTEEQRTRRTHFIDYNVGALLWANTQTVMNLGRDWAVNGLLLPDEARRLINYPALPDGRGAKLMRPANTIIDGEEQTPPANDPDQPAIHDQQTGETLSAWRDLAAATITRMVGRLNVQARRAVEGRRLATWLAGVDADHRDTLAEMWAPVGRLGIAIGLRDSGGLVADLLTAYRQDLSRAGVDPLAEIERYHRDAGQAFAQQFLNGRTDSDQAH